MPGLNSITTLLGVEEIQDLRYCAYYTRRAPMPMLGLRLTKSTTRRPPNMRCADRKAMSMRSETKAAIKKVQRW
jgi:hypothetical protein